MTTGARSTKSTVPIGCCLANLAQKAPTSEPRGAARTRGSSREWLAHRVATCRMTSATTTAPYKIFSAHDAWRRLGEKHSLKDLVEKLREHHRRLSDGGALPALVFVQLTGRVSDREALLAHLREHDRLTEPADGEDHDDSGLLHDALLRPVEYEPAEDGDESVWIASISRTGLLEGGELLVEVPLQIDAVGLRRHRATDDLEQLIPRVIAEFAEETPGVELIDVAAERIG